MDCEGDVCLVHVRLIDAARYREGKSSVALMVCVHETQRDWIDPMVTVAVGMPL
jgi:hypothetical protein